MNKVYTEIGYGNDTFINTETEFPDGSEVRKPGFKKMKFRHLYIRIWFKYTQYVLSSKDGLVIIKKNRKNLKFLLGVGGTES